jgi:hypothetical protein
MFPQLLPAQHTKTYIHLKLDHSRLCYREVDVGRRTVKERLAPCSGEGVIALVQPPAATDAQLNV